VKTQIKKTVKAQTKSTVKPQIRKTYDGNRQRCIGCGHPLREHRAAAAVCTVPKCKCEKYASPTVLELDTAASR
jgi:hypothetical protein